MSHPRPPTKTLSWLSIVNMSVGFLGIQFGWGLQMANMSAIYQFLGASEADIPLLWLAAPVTGLIVQPIIGYYSDRTWTRLGRRRPYFLIGAILASLALIAMPNSPTLWMAAGLLWVLDASVNVCMEPFRAFVGDLLPPQQRKIGFAMQSVFIGFGAVAANFMPWLLRNVAGMGGDDVAGRIPGTVVISFYVGSAVFLAAVLHTILTTRENPPPDLEAFRRHKAETAGVGRAFSEIFSGIFQMPPTMRKLALVQFFTWLGLFCMWLYFTPVISRTIFQAEPNTAAHTEAVEWGGFCFGTYNFVAFVFAFALIPLARRFSARSVHIVCLLCGGLGLATTSLWTSQYALLISMIGVGVAWASILSMPYAMLANVLPPGRMGFFMGVFNFFIVLPQIFASTLLGPIVRTLFGGSAVHVITAGGIAMLIAALATLAVPKTETS